MGKEVKGNVEENKKIKIYTCSKSSKLMQLCVLQMLIKCFYCFCILVFSLCFILEYVFTLKGKY